MTMPNRSMRGRLRQRQHENLAARAILLPIQVTVTKPAAPVSATQGMIDGSNEKAGPQCGPAAVGTRSPLIDSADFCGLLFVNCVTADILAKRLLAGFFGGLDTLVDVLVFRVDRFDLWNHLAFFVGH